MTEDLLRRLLGGSTGGHQLSREGIEALLSRINRAPPGLHLHELVRSNAPSDRLRALSFVLNEALAMAKTVSKTVRKRIARRLEESHLAPRPELARELAEIVGELLATWPHVSEELLSRLEAALFLPHESQITTPEGSTAPTAGLPHPNSGTNEEDTMASKVEVEVDVRGLPPTLQDPAAQLAYVKEVNDKLLVATGGLDAPFEAAAYAVGKLLRTGQFDAKGSSFASFVKQAWGDLTTEYRGRSGKVPGLTIVKKIVELLGGKSNGVNIPAKPWKAQQLAFIYDEALATLQTIGPDDSGFATRVDRAYLDYASGDVGNDGFQLPELDATTDGDLISPNMLSAGRLYGAYGFELIRLIPVVDRITELWRAGVVPIGNDSGGQLLNEYFWSREDRLTESARGMIFGRLFGVKNTEATKDALPNTDFDAIFRRFLTNVAQLRRLQDQQTVISNPGESRTLASENVRKTGRELATNLSLRGWGSALFDANRIDAHIAVAYKIADDPQVQKAFAAATPWQVVERVSQQEFGAVPNIVKYHTMAVSGRRIIEILAQNLGALTGRDREFPDALGADLWNELSRLALAWLSVNGVTSEQLVSYSAPVDGIASPSLPTMPGAQPATPNMSRIRDMVSSGQMPSLDQLQRMFN
jgi:hypothetical protein